ncbi:MAG: energy-coupling factor ABC transporter ATP-binding protein [Arenicellales bacterium]
MSDNLLSIKRLSKKWHRKPVLSQLELNIKAGQCLLIQGENGSGKSTLLRIIAGLLKPDEAQINTGITSQNWSAAQKMLRAQTLYLHQAPYLFEGTVEKNLAYVQSTRAIKEAAHWADIAHLLGQRAKTLSGGERQRVALARAWLKQAKIVLLDEPSANLDKSARQRLLELLQDFKTQGVAVVIASHDPAHFKQLIDETLTLENGQLDRVSHVNNVVAFVPKKAS